MHNLAPFPLPFELFHNLSKIFARFHKLVSYFRRSKISAFFSCQTKKNLEICTP